MKKVFIDGSAGTTGLRIRERLAPRKDLTLLTLPEEFRKDPKARKEALWEADVAFLCLPDDAAREAVALAESSDTAIIDTSTAHRTHPQWVYGMAELPNQRGKIASSKRVANPGCHAGGFIALVAPLVQAGLLDPNTALCCFSLTGYTGGGKKMIAEYEDENRISLLDAPRQYGLGQQHKHLKEMVALCGLNTAPAFCPIVGDFPCGMEVTVPLFAKDLKGTVKDIENLYASLYNTGLIRFVPNANEGGFLSANAMAGRDDMQITLAGNEDRPLLIARFDNLGKGASGAAIQNMNILLGVDETTGLQF